MSVSLNIGILNVAASISFDDTTYEVGCAPDRLSFTTYVDKSTPTGSLGTYNQYYIRPAAAGLLLIPIFAPELALLFA